VISEDDLIQIAEDICLSLLAEGTDLPTGNGSGAAGAGPVRTMTAVIDINGDWNGSVSISCERSTAVGIASVMFAAPEPELSTHDLIDALGEFANMAGGAVKGMFDGEKTLGLPTVGEGLDFTMSVPHTVEMTGVDYRLAGSGVVRLAVHQLIADRAAS
jgi:CheY-specific phosphatase CheX